VSAVIAGEADAYRLLETLRWEGPPPACPHCATPGRCYYLQPADGVSRRTRTGARSARRVWKCGACRRQFSVLTGTVLEGTRVSLLAWVAVVADLVSDPSVEAAAVAQRHRVSPEAARHMLARLAVAMAAVSS
jgi:transposase-like protein